MTLLPPKIRALAELCRVSNLPTAWMNVTTATVLSTGGVVVDVGILVRLCLAMSALYAAGVCLNDIVDREHDAVDKPARPIPSGRVELWEARTLVVVLFIVGLALAAQDTPPETATAALVLVGFIVAYNLLHKLNPLAIVLMGACRFLVYPTTALALGGEILPVVGLAGMITFSYTMAISLVARYETARQRPYQRPLVPWMLSGMPLIDGLVIAVFAGGLWPMAGGAAFLLTLAAQYRLRGD